MGYYIDLKDTEISKEVYLCKTAPTCMTLLYRDGTLSRKRITRILERLDKYEKEVYNTSNSNPYCKLLKYMLYNIGKQVHEYKTVRVTESNINAVISDESKLTLSEILHKVGFYSETEAFNKEKEAFERNHELNQDKYTDKRKRRIERERESIKSTCNRYSLADKHLKREELQKEYCNIIKRLTGKTCDYYKASWLSTTKFGITTSDYYVHSTYGLAGSELVNSVQREGVADIRLLLKQTKSEDYAEFLYAMRHKKGCSQLGMSLNDMADAIGIKREALDVLLYKMGIKKELNPSVFTREIFKQVELMEIVTGIK